MPTQSTVKLGVNIDHVATLRQARGGKNPELIRAALEVISAGAEGITVHLREDRRHILDRDVFQLKESITVPLNLEMSVAEDIVKIACRLKPAKACLVPERREELTTEGGLDVARAKKHVARVVGCLQERGVLVSLFIDPIPKQIEAAYDVDTDFIELHTGRYANRMMNRRRRELKRLRQGAIMAHALGLGVNAGHGLDYGNVKPVARLPHIRELNIGHSIVSRSVFVGLRRAVKEMRALIRSASS